MAHAARAREQIAAPARGPRSAGAAARAVDRLQDVQVDAQSGLHIGSIIIGKEALRVGIRPLPPTVPACSPPLLMFNGIGANMELAGLLISKLDRVETLIFDLPGAGGSPPPKWPYQLFMMARLARKLPDALGYGTVDVMGVSWGVGWRSSSQFSIRKACVAWCWPPPRWAARPCSLETRVCC